MVLFFSFPISCLFFAAKSFSPTLPSFSTPICFYSNQTTDDLRTVFYQSFQSAKDSLTLIFYGCTDSYLLEQLTKLSAKGIDVKLFYDTSGSGNLSLNYPFAFPVVSKGLMHQKIAIIDTDRLFFGTANLTPTSLRVHDNVVIGIQHDDLVSFILSGQTQRFSSSVAFQPFDFWILPDTKNRCLSHITSLIMNAKKEIYISLFTLTHPTLIDSLISAHKRGVAIHLAIDGSCAKGCGKPSIRRLKAAGIDPWILDQKGKLLHHKWAIIDNHTLLLGSANWTKQAFKKNDDCLFILHQLSQEQQTFFRKIWKKIKRGGKLFSEWSQEDGCFS